MPGRRVGRLLAQKLMTRRFPRERVNEAVAIAQDGDGRAFQERDVEDRRLGAMNNAGEGLGNEVDFCEVGCGGWI